jgi:hypothetical protein
MRLDLVKVAICLAKNTRILVVSGDPVPQAFNDRMWDTANAPVINPVHSERSVPSSHKNGAGLQL